MPVHNSEMWSQQIQLAKMKKSDLAICLQKGGETGGRESEGRSDLVKFFKLFQNGRIWNSHMTESNSVELFNVEFFWTEKLTLKVEIPLFWGFVPPSDFPKSGGDPVYGNLPPPLHLLLLQILSFPFPSSDWKLETTWFELGGMANCWTFFR